MKPLLAAVAVVVLIFFVPIGEWMVDERWRLGLPATYEKAPRRSNDGFGTWTIYDGLTARSEWLSVWDYFSVKRKGMLYGRVKR